VKHFTWLGALAAAIAAGIYWTRPTVDLAEPAPTERQSASPKPRPPAAASSRKSAATIEMIEPILVLPEWEVAPVPEAVDGTVMRDGEIGDSSATSNVPRPEAGRTPRLWMPYADEDRELSDTRRLEWTKLAVREGPPADFEETAEPPQIELRPQRGERR
jgi:hypothetical protein